MKRALFLLMIIMALFAAVGCGDAAEPVINSASPQSVLQVLKNAEIIFFVDATDPGDEPLTYQWAASAGSPASGTGSSFRWTAPDQPDSCTVSVTVLNGKKYVTRIWEISVVEILADMTVISGVIRGSLPNSVIRGATITAVSGTSRFQTSSDDRGVYTLQVPAGYYTMTAQMLSFNDATADVQASGAAVTNQDFTLTTGAEGTFSFPGGSLLAEGRTGPDSFETRLSARSSPVGYRCYGFISYAFSPTNSPIDGIRIYRKAPADTSYTLISVQRANPSAGSILLDYCDDDPGFSPGQTMNYTISAWGDTGESGYSPLKTATFLPELTLVAPQNGATITSGTPVTFQWNLLSGVSASYFMTLERWTGSHWYYIWGGPGVEVAQYTYSAPLEAGSTYRWSVSATAAAGGDRSCSYFRTFSVVNP